MLFAEARWTTDLCHSTHPSRPEDEGQREEQEEKEELRTSKKEEGRQGERESQTDKKRETQREKEKKQIQLTTKGARESVHLCVNEILKQSVLVVQLDRESVREMKISGVVVDMSESNELILCMCWPTWKITGVTYLFL